MTSFDIPKRLSDAVIGVISKTDNIKAKRTSTIKQAMVDKILYKKTNPLNNRGEPDG